jgi:curved DNA-binding protein CbpA
MKAQTMTELLGIAEDASDAQVKKAYFKLAKEFHPDKLYNHQERTVKKYADRAFGLVNKAYEQLKTVEGRKAYFQRQKELAEGIDLDKEAQSLLQSEVEFQKGIVLLRKKDFAGAAAQFRTAIELNPRESDHYAYCGWSEFQVSYPSDESGWKNAVAKLEKALELNEKAHDAMFFLGQVAKLTGNLERAEQMFNKVLKFRPNHVEAQRELRLINQRREKEGPAGKDKKLMDKLFNK